MFNKSLPPSRNDNITRKEVRPLLNSGATGALDPLSRPTTDIPSAGSANAAPATGESKADIPMGARLLVGPEVKLKGAEILDCDTLVVEGRVEATMDSRIIRITDQGTFSGKVCIDVAEIHGRFEGELTARSQLIIHATGKVSGKIRYGKLVIDEGGELCGDINALSAEKRPPSLPEIERNVVFDSAAT